MDKSAIRIKYWGMGNTLLFGDEEYTFSSNEDVHKAIEIIETIDVSLGGKRHDRKQL